MAVTQNLYTGDGSTVLFSFTFPYLETTDIKVTVNGTPTTAYTLANPTTVQFNSAPSNGAAIRIYRKTDDSALQATFSSGSAIRAQDLNDNFTQNLYVTQEVNNTALQSDGSVAMVQPFNAGGNRIINAAIPTNGTDVSTKGYVDSVVTSSNPFFTQSGAGAVSRTWDSKLKDFVSAKDFGVVGDGITDDKTAIQAAVAAASGRTILFTPGTYKLASAYAAPSGTKFYLQTGAIFSVNQPTNVAITYETGRASDVSGSKMKIGSLLEGSSYKLENEAGIWPSASTYAFQAFSSEMTANTVGSPGTGILTNAPLSTLVSYANSNGVGADVVAILGVSVARQSPGSCFGANFIARNDGGVNGAKLVGLEIDLEPATGTTISNESIGLVLNVFSIATSAPAVLIGTVGGGTWGNGCLSQGITGTHYGVSSANTTTSTSFINTTQGTFSSAALLLGTGASQAINFGGGAFGTSPYTYGDSGGSLIVNMGTSGFVVFQNPAGAQRFTFDQFGAFNMPNNGVLKINSTQVVAQRQTGYTNPMTGTANKATSYSTATITLQQLAERVKALQDDLTTHGLIGA